MKKRPINYLLYVILGLFVVSCSKGASTTNKDKVIHERIDQLIKQMTLEEKVGQMTQITLDIVSEGEFEAVKYPHRLDSSKLNIAIIKYKVGSILNTAGKAHNLEHWNEVISEIQDKAVNESRLGIPILYGIDAIHGTNYTIGATLFPQQIGLAATWNPVLVKQLAALSAYETRASSIPWDFAPVLGLGRNPLWPRFWETFGEDVYLSSEMGKAFVKGLQGDDLSNHEKVAACLKHYVGYSFPLSGKDRTQAWIPENYMTEYFLYPFKTAIDNGALTVMVNSSEVNGTPMHASYHYLTEILKKEYGFKGFIVTDWADIKYLNNRHHIAKTQKEAVKIAVNAGIDMSMVPDDYSFADYLIELVKEGEVPMSRINDAVSRILYVKMKLGLFDKPVTNYKDYHKFGSDEFKNLSKEAAIESITLLKNSNSILPLSKDKKVLVTGPTANTMRSLNGGWSYTWQGEQSDQFAKDKNTILEALQQKIGENNVVYSEGTGFNKDINTEKTVALAKKADVIILCLGETSYTEKPGDFSDLNLEEVQLQLASKLAQTGKPVILVLAEGRPRIIRKIVDKAQAIVMAYLPGNEGADALADILFGDANPSGKLPFTYPRYANALVCYDHKYTDEVSPRESVKGFNPQFEFGTGLSYTKFTYSNLNLSHDSINESQKLTISVDVQNIGETKGKEVVQLYISDIYASITPSVKRLKAFEKIELKPKETKTVKFDISAKDLAFVNSNNVWITQKGVFKVSIDTLNTTFLYQ